jgi:hypothetical protein
MVSFLASESLKQQWITFNRLCKVVKKEHRQCSFIYCGTNSVLRPWFEPGSVHVGFVVDGVALGQVFLRVLWFSPVNLIPPLFHYTEKLKNKSSPSQGCTTSLKAAVRP